MYIKKQTNNSISSSYESVLSGKSSFNPFDFPELIYNLKEDQSWQRGEINSLIMLESPVKRIVLIMLHEGTEISSFQLNDSITFQILEGKLVLHLGKKTLNLKEGEEYTLREKINYVIDSAKETALLLTIHSEK